MTFSLPTISDTVRRARLAFRSELKGSDATIWPNNLYATAKVIGGAMKGLFDRLDIVARDIHAHTAGLDGVLRHATEFGLTRQPAAPAAGDVIVTTSGPSLIARGATLLRSDGVAYIAAAARTTQGSETYRLPVAAVLAGAAGNLEPDAALTPDDGTQGAIDSVVVAEAGLRGGADPEDIGTSLRARVLFRKRNPIHGGAPADYVTWAGEVAGVTRVFVARRPFGRGTTAVYPMMDGTRPNGIPLAADIVRIAEHVDLFAPSDAEVFVTAATPFPIDVTLSRLVPNTAAVQAAIRIELADMLLRRGRVAGADPGHPALPFLTTPLTIQSDWIGEAISQAAGEDSHSVAGPTAPIAIPAGHLPVLGALVFPQVSS